MRRYVACKNFPVLEMRAMMGVDSPGHLGDKANSETPTVVCCDSTCAISVQLHCAGARPLSPPSSNTGEQSS